MTLSPGPGIVSGTSSCAVVYVIISLSWPMTFPAAFHIMKQLSTCDTKRLQYPKAKWPIASGMTAGMFLPNPGKGPTPQGHLIKFLLAGENGAEFLSTGLGLKTALNHIPSVEKTAKSLTVPGYDVFFRVLEKLALSGQLTVPCPIYRR